MADANTHQRLIEIAAGDRPEPGDLSLDEARIVARYRQAAGLARRAAEWNPPAATLAAAKAIFRPAEARDSLRAQIREFVARLVLDSRTQPLAVRAATTGQDVHLAYEGDGFEVDLSIEPEGPDGRIRLRGQIDTDDGTPPTLVRCRAADEVDVQADCDERGRFEFRLAPGRYELRAESGDRELIVSDVDLS